MKFAKFWVENNTNVDLSFLDGGKLKAYGLGGALMLDYEKFAPEHDDDLEIRYTNVELRSYGSTNLGVVGHAKSESVSLWARRRMPTGWGVVWDRPVRYVFEVATTRYLGDETELGLTQMSSIGLGLELDSSALDRLGDTLAPRSDATSSALARRAFPWGWRSASDACTPGHKD